MSGEKENTRCRILLPCRKQLQAQLDHIETMERANLKTAISKSSLRPAAAHGAEPLQQSGHAGLPEISFSRSSRWRRTAPQWNSSRGAGRGNHRTSWNKTRIPIRACGTKGPDRLLAAMDIQGRALGPTTTMRFTPQQKNWSPLAMRRLPSAPSVPSRFWAHWMLYNRIRHRTTIRI